MEKFKINSEMAWECIQCGPLYVEAQSPEPSTENVYREVTDVHGDSIETLVPVVTESYISLKCNKCSVTEFEAL